MATLAELEQRRKVINENIRSSYLIKSSISPDDYRRYPDIYEITTLKAELKQINLEISRMNVRKDKSHVELRGGYGNRILYTYTYDLDVHDDDDKIGFKQKTKDSPNLESNNDIIFDYVKHLTESKKPKPVKNTNSSIASYKMTIKKKVKQYIILVAMRFTNGEQYDMLVEALIKTVKLEEDIC